MSVLARVAIVFGCLVVAGCAANPGIAVDTSDPMWTPPGQGDLAVADSPEAPAPKRAPRARTLQQPNHAAISSDGLHPRRPQRR